MSFFCGGCESYLDGSKFSPSQIKVVRKHFYCKKCMKIARETGHFPKYWKIKGIISLPGKTLTQAVLEYLGV